MVAHSDMHTCNNVVRDFCLILGVHLTGIIADPCGISTFTHVTTSYTHSNKFHVKIYLGQPIGTTCQLYNIMFHSPIFLYGIFMVYSKVTHVSFIYRKKWTFPLLFSYLAACFQVFLNLRYICVLYVWIWTDVRNRNM